MTTRSAEVLWGMAGRLMAGTFSAGFGLGPEGQAQMVQALYAEVGRLSAGIIRARSRAGVAAARRRPARSPPGSASRSEFTHTRPAPPQDIVHLAAIFLWSAR
ncbi:hypothetical protein ACWGJT_11635 [Streptomyces xantholiticus]